MTFKDGGAFDFHSTFERIRDSVAQAQENARDNGSALDPGSVHLDQLPAYDEVAGGGGGRSVERAEAQAPMIAPRPIRPAQGGSRAAGSMDGAGSVERGQAPATMQHPPPDEPPPGYEEAQSSGI